MANFGWAYVNCEDNAPGSGSFGPDYSLQFVTESDGGTTGSALLKYYTASYYSYDPSTVVLSGNMIVTGAISASTYHIKDIALIDATGSTDFGDSKDDHHFRTGSFVITTAGAAPSSYTFSASVVDSRVSLTQITASKGGYFAGRVGIGTATPSTVLHVVDEHPTITIKSNTANGDGQIKFKSTNGTDLANLRCDTTSNTLNHFAISAGTGEDDLVVDQTGYVGIGTTSPTNQLTVVGSISGSSTLENVGATTLGSTLDVSGAIAGASNIGTTGGFLTASAQLKGLSLVLEGQTAIDKNRNATLAGVSGSGALQAVGNAYLGGTLNVSGASTMSGNVLPYSDDTYDLGSGAKRWANLYTGDLHLKNERGDWTIIEEEEYLTLRNNKTGKRYKLAMEEIE